MAKKIYDLIVLDNLKSQLNDLICATKALYYENFGKKFK